VRKAFYIPLGLFVILVIILSIGLTRDPRTIPSPLINKPAPEFTLPLLYRQAETFSPQQMRGKVWLLNVFASWCSGCRAEHHFLMQMARIPGVNLYGLNYKDVPLDGKKWLEQFGNPYKSVAKDINGRVGIDWGVYGVPETFVIDKQGIIRYKQIGPIDQKAINETLLPLIKKLQLQ